MAGVVAPRECVMFRIVESEFLAADSKRKAAQAIGEYSTWTTGDGPVSMAHP
jgi:hypothetical protein